MITNISVERLNPHPDNPRKDLGDLTELAESIKSRGVMQNLTVVPYKSGFCPTCEAYITYGSGCSEGYEGRPPCPKYKWNGGYTVVIGHRRLAAAKLAGLTELPCVISEMDHKDQVATMLLENMQRSDLTVYEQAQGFQMMLDLGETAATIAEKTGFSETTIRRRVKLTELDQKKFAASLKRGGTLMDYAELEKIKDPELRSQVLDFIGTNNFKWKLEQMLEEETMPAKREAFVKMLSEFATEITEVTGNMAFKSSFYKFETTGWNKPSDAGERKYYFLINGKNATLYVEKKEEDAGDKLADLKAEELRLRNDKLRALTKKAYEMRKDFILNFKGAKKYDDEIKAFALDAMLVTQYWNGPKFALEALGIKEPTSGFVEEKLELMGQAIREKYFKNPEYVMLIMAYDKMADDEDKGYFRYKSWENAIEYAKNKRLDRIYSALFKLGYDASDEECQLQDGTHELLENPAEEPGADEMLCDDEFPCDDCIYDEGGGCGYDCGDDDYYCIEGDKRIRRSDE